MSSRGMYRSKRQSSAAHNAVSSLDAAALERALQEQPISLNAKDINGYSPLHLACLKKSSDMVQVLLRLGGDKLKLDAADNAGWTPIHCAALNGSSECLILLIDNGGTCDLIHSLAPPPLTHHWLLISTSHFTNSSLMMELFCCSALVPYDQ